MHKLKNVSICTDANLANSHCGKHQLALIKGLRCENLKVLDKFGVGAYLSTGVIIKYGVSKIKSGHISLLVM